MRQHKIDNENWCWRYNTSLFEVPKARWWSLVSLKANGVKLKNLFLQEHYAHLAVYHQERKEPSTDSSIYVTDSVIFSVIEIILGYHFFRTNLFGEPKKQVYVDQTGHVNWWSGTKYQQSLRYTVYLSVLICYFQSFRDQILAVLGN